MGIQVTINLPREVLITIREALKDEHNDLVSRLAENDRNLEAIRKAIDNSQSGEQILKTLVDSESVYGKQYLVTLRYGLEWTCSCPAFQFKHGLDLNGDCKHIRLVKSEGRFA